MGTRNLTCVWIDKKFRVAQYGQWDGYPSGVGADILSFLKSSNLEQLKKNVRNVRWAKKNEIEKAWESVGADKSGLVNLDVSERFANLYPQWSRDSGAKVLSMLHTKNLRLKDSRSFGTDGLFCEWAYVIDLDAMKLEVYTGFNKQEGKDHGKFSKIKRDKKVCKDYTPVVLVKSYSLTDLPTEENFIKECNPPEEE